MYKYINKFKKLLESFILFLHLLDPQQLLGILYVFRQIFSLDFYLFFKLLKVGIGPLAFTNHFLVLLHVFFFHHGLIFIPVEDILQHSSPLSLRH